ncbi:hypothetical protein G9A89_009538 [Geosiphon pyriformis]|nr:hypothetical protein G9A89_009538 [Geosiphon pyriformis]
MVMEENKTKTLEKRVIQLGEELSKKIKSYLILDPRRNTYQPPQRRSQEVSDSRNNHLLCQEFRTEMCACHFCKHVKHLISQCQTRMMQEAHENNYYMPPQMPRNQYMPIPHQYSTTQPELASRGLKSAYVEPECQTNPNYQNYQQTYLNIPENLIIGNNDSKNINRTKNSSNKLSQTIPLAVVTKDSSLAAIFPFELEENEAMFSGAALDKKSPITAMYMEATVNNTPIKLILNSERNWKNSWKDIPTIDTIESLSIIQKTPSKPSDTTPSEHHHESIILQRTSTDNTKPKVAESEIIGANHLGFAKSLLQHYCQYLGLNHNYISAKSAFNFYVNKKISSLLGTSVNTELARETFYKELIQNTNLLTNHNFASIITEINKKIEHHTQQRYPITYASKSKRKLQTPAVTPRKIQPPAWKKNRVESPSNPFYHYTLGSAINISSTDTFPSTDHMTNTLRNLIRLRSPLPPPDFGISDLWEAAESKKKKKESEDQEFTYQHLITENPEVETPNIQTQQYLENPEIETPNIQTPPNQRNQKPKLINQQNLPPLPLQQPGQQQLLQQSPQPFNLDPMAYAPIAKLDNFTGEENDAQVWLNNVEKAITVNEWNDTRAIQAIPYFLKNTANSCNNNSINCLVNAFTTIKQRKTEAVTTYLGRFHRNLRQIQAIDTNYFTAPQILNQFICGLHSSILQHVRPLHPGTLQNTVTRARDFESAKSKANHTQAINLVINGSSELDSKLEKFSESINKRLKKYLADNHPCPSLSTNQRWQQETCICHYCVPNSELVPKSKPIHLPTSDTVIHLSVSGVSSSNLSTTATSDLSTIPTTQQNPKTENDSTELEIGNSSPSTNSQFFTAIIWIMPVEFGYWSSPEPKFPEDASTNNPAFAQKQPLISNISFATITEDESLAAIFPFKFKETAAMLLFSEATLKAKPITAIYTDVKIEGQLIKLILDSGSAGSIITRQFMNQLGCRVDRAVSARIIIADGVTKTPISEIDNFSFEVNGIVTSIKVLVMEATQYQALVGPTHTCTGHMWPLQDSSKRETIDQTGEEERETYLGSLPSVKTDDLTWTDNNKNELTSSWEWEENKEEKRKGKERKEENKEEKGKGKERKEENTQTNNTYISYTYGQQQLSTYC